MVWGGISHADDSAPLVNHSARLQLDELCIRSVHSHVARKQQNHCDGQQQHRRPTAHHGARVVVELRLTVTPLIRLIIPFMIPTDSGASRNFS